ncbi:MAG TPA: hypothetical protein VFU27_15075, partial [Terriglobales bacterium]|nr:hypothetical protein [Terriglobales bacterium]
MEPNSNQQLTAKPAVRVPRAPSPVRHLLSRLRSYFIFDPLIWCYTIVLAISSLLSSFIDRGGRIQHAHARLWSWLIL